jgi:hypothetical protein
MKMEEINLFEEINNIIKDYNDNISIDKICKLYNKKENDIKIILKEHENLLTRSVRTKWWPNVYQLHIILNDYKNNVPLKITATKFGIEQTTLSRMLKSIISKKREGQLKNVDIKHNYFSSIDTEEKAYWLGILITDGNIYKNKISLGMKLSDIDHIKKFKAEIGNKSKLYLRKNQPFVSTEFHSAKMVRDLLKLGITERKSLTIAPPVLKEDLQRHFWRGVIDGDGSLIKFSRICKKFNKSGTKEYQRYEVAISLVGSFGTCSGFLSWANKVLGITKCQKLHKVKNIYQITYNAIMYVEKLCKILYENSTISLDRKLIKSKEIIEFINTCNIKPTKTII